MVYFLGRDVDVYITLEVPLSVGVLSGAFVTGSATENTLGPLSGSTACMVFASPLDISATGPEAGYASGTQNYGLVSDLTGVDLSIGAVDEDITYFGKRSVTKAEVKKETTVTLTRKKTSSTWDVVFDQGRNGCNTTGDFTANNLIEPQTTTGYRLHVVLRSGSADANLVHDEVFSVLGCCVQGHSTSVNADGVSEETLEFMSYIDPNIGDVIYTTAIGSSEV